MVHLYAADLCVYMYMYMYEGAIGCGHSAATLASTYQTTVLMRSCTS